MITFDPLKSGMPETLQFVVPLATPLPPAIARPSDLRDADVIRRVPPMDIVEDDVEYVVPVVGVLIVAVGRVVSPAGAVMTQVNDCDAVNTPSEARAVTE